MRKNLLLTLLLMGSAASAQETVKHTYDALGRLTNSTVTGGPVNGTSTTVSYDRAGNRSSYVVGGAPTSTPPSNSRRVIVLPLNGFVVIPLRSGTFD